MTGSATDLSVAFAAGVTGFASPCILPLIPGYLSFVSGAEAATGSVTRRTTAILTSAFVLGFAAVFTLAGAGVGLAGAQFLDHRRALEVVGGVLVVAMGLIMLLPRVPLFERELRLPMGARPNGPAGAATAGAAFAIGWSPCLTPTLASILAIAGTAGRAGEGAALLAAYSLGLGLPFILAGLFLGAFLDGVRPLRRHLGTISRVAGVLLVATGLLLASGQLTQITARLNQ
jgi:cytochrome c-type biogenesis protein